MKAPVLRISFLPMRGIALVLFVCTKGKQPAYVEAHEQVHIRQQWRGWIIGFLLAYLFSAKKRANYEAEAYAVSVKHGMNLMHAAAALSENYRTGLSKTKAGALIESYGSRA